MKLNMKIFDSMKITTNIRYEHLVDYQAFKQQRVGKNAHPLSPKTLIYNNLRKTPLVKRFPVQA